MVALEGGFFRSYFVSLVWFGGTAVYSSAVLSSSLLSINSFTHPDTGHHKSIPHTSTLTVVPSKICSSSFGSEEKYLFLISSTLQLRLHEHEHQQLCAIISTVTARAENKWIHFLCDYQWPFAAAAAANLLGQSWRHIFSFFLPLSLSVKHFTDRPMMKCCCWHQSVSQSVSFSLLLLDLWGISNCCRTVDFLLELFFF